MESQGESGFWYRCSVCDELTPGTAYKSNGVLDSLVKNMKPLFDVHRRLGHSHTDNTEAVDRAVHCINERANGIRDDETESPAIRWRRAFVHLLGNLY